MEFFNEVWKKGTGLSVVLLRSRSTNTDTCLRMKCAVDSRQLALSTAFYKKLRFVRFGFTVDMPLGAVDSVLLLDESEMVFEFVSDPNSDFRFLFFWDSILI